MALYDVVNGVYRKVIKKYDKVDGVYRNVTKAYDPVDGVYRQYFSGGTPVSTLAVGDSVWLNVNGSLTKFLVVHQGNPDSAMYDASCDGTWLLMQDLFVRRIWNDYSDYGGQGNNDYKNSIAHSYLNGYFLGFLDSGTQSAIKQIKLPYHNGTGSGGSVASGADGLSTKIFLLSGYEVGWTKSTSSYFPMDGAKLSYFASGTGDSANAKRKAIFNGSYALWWLRSPHTQASSNVWAVNTAGKNSYSSYADSYGIRPAFILDSNTTFDNSTGKNIIA